MRAQNFPVAGDQAVSLPFRLTLTAQAAAALVLGVAPLLALSAFVSAIGFSGADPLIYQLGAAATLGYFVAPAIALVGRARWREIQIPAMATATFAIGAVVGSAWELATGGRQPIVPVALVAAAVFTVIEGYWLRRSEGAEIDSGRRLDQFARIVLALATLSAATFGLLPLLVPGVFASLFGLAGTDTWVFRMAGAACLGYATGGIASLLAPGYRLMRIQNMAAIAFNAVAAISAWQAISAGTGGLLATFVAAAASFFTIALIWVDRKYRV